MCLFPTPNVNFNSLAFKKGITEFDCGACPECLQKRSGTWALRASYEAREHIDNCMITLTYDRLKYPGSSSLEEFPVDPNVKVCKRHIQLFIKRLRKWYSSFRPGEKIKYLCCAEYGSRTHRAHYHLILFNVSFPDVHYYKKSKRGNVIYTSSILEKLWSYGICSVDSININSAVARYCTKYCAKSRSDDTFMLCSQGIGFNGLIKDFNGCSYFVEGRQYPIPRFVWEYYIMNKYSKFSSIVSPKYVNHNSLLRDDPFVDDSEYYLARANRKRYRFLRDRDPLYISYLDYWSRFKVYSENRPSSINRIYLLDDSKYHNYKIAAINCYSKRAHFVPVVAPGSNCVSYFERYKFYLVPHLCPRNFIKPVTCPVPPCPNRASDTKFVLNPFNNKFEYDVIYNKINFYHYYDDFLSFNS